MTRDQDACGLVQPRHTVPGSILYHSYWYRSGVNRTMTENLHGIARTAEELAGPRAGRPGGRHRLQRRHAARRLRDGRDVRFLGFDPSDVTRYAVEKGYDVVRDFFARGARAAATPTSKAKVITSIAMFYDLEDPRAFVARRGRRASPRTASGSWSCTTCRSMLEAQRLRRDRPRAPRVLLAGRDRAAARPRRASRSIQRRAQRHQRRLDPALHRPCRPAPISPAEAPGRLQKLRIREFEMALDSPAPYERFRRASSGPRRSRGPLRQARRPRARRSTSTAPPPRATRSSSTRASTARLIPYAADRNPDKWGSETIGTRIPIISEEESRAMQSRLLPRAALALPRRVPRARGRVPRAGRQLHRSAARGPRHRSVRSSRRMSQQKRALITGITGQDGSYLAELLLEKGYEVHGMVRRSSTETFQRLEPIRDSITLHTGDLLDQRSLVDVLRDVRAGRDLQPRGHVVRGGLVVAAGAHGGVHGDRASRACSRRCARSRPTRASTRPRRRRCSGRCCEVPQTREHARSIPRSPYGVAKAYGHFITVNYRESYDLFAALGDPLQPRERAPRAGVRDAQGHPRRRRDQARAPERAGARQPRRRARLGLRQGLRRGDVADAPAGRAGRLRDRHGRGAQRARARGRRVRACRASTPRRMCASTRASCAPPRSSTSSATRPRPARSSAGSRARASRSMVRLMVDADLELLARRRSAKTGGLSARRARRG